MRRMEALASIAAEGGVLDGLTSKPSSEWLVRKGVGMKRKLGLAVLLSAFGVALWAGSVLATPQSGVSTKLLANKIPFDEIDIKAQAIPADVWQARLKTQGLSDVYVVDNVIQPGGTTGWHSHPGPSLISVVAGTVTNYTSDDPSCAGRDYQAGTGFVDPGGGDVHTLVNNGDVPAETIAVQILPKDATRRVDVEPPANCSS
jgi:quercetin dioxygenase-like cupin family protein